MVTTKRLEGRSSQMALWRAKEITECRNRRQDKVQWMDRWALRRKASPKQEEDGGDDSSWQTSPMCSLRNLWAATHRSGLEAVRAARERKTRARVSGGSEEEQ